MQDSRPLDQNGRFRLALVVSSRWTRLGLYFGFWTVLGLLNAGSAIIENWDAPSVSMWEPLVWEMSSLYTTGLLCPLVVWLSRRHPFRLHDWYRFLPVHLAGMVGFSLAHTFGMMTLRKIVYVLVGESYAFGGKQPGVQLLYEFYKDVPLYWIIVCLALGFEYYNKYRQQQLASSRLQTRLTQARLENLKNQLNPHFLFNSLNAISSFVREEPDRAERMLARLGDLLRSALRTTGRREISLREELETLDLYLELMEARFGDQFEVRRGVSSDLLELRVPALILQPLVENAIRHGIARRQDSRGRVQLSAWAEDGRLHLRVRDNGPGTDLPSQHLLEAGVGLSNTRERLWHLYGDDATLRAGNLEVDDCGSPFKSGGFEVEVILPQLGRAEEAQWPSES